MTGSIMIIISAAVAAAASATWIVARKRSTRRERAAADLYRRYLADVKAITQAYLLQAPSDEEWLAGLKPKALAPARASLQAAEAGSARTAEANLGKTPPDLEYRQEIEACFTSMSGAVDGFLRRFTQGDGELSPALVQETFMKAAQNWHKLRDLTEKDREAWLIRAAANTAVDSFRRQETERKTELQIRDLHSSAATDACRQAMTSTATRRFIEVTAAMPPAQSRVAFLRWRCGLSNQEIAQALGITAGQASQQLNKTRRLLTKELGPYLLDASLGGGR